MSNDSVSELMNIYNPRKRKFN